MVLFDRMRDILKDNGFTGSWRRHDQGTLTFPNGRNQIDHAGRTIFDRRIIDFHLQTFVRVERGEVVKGNLVPGTFRIFEVDLCNVGQRKITFVFIRGLDNPINRIPCSQRIAADHVRRHINVIWSRQVVCLR